jgi:hypothetical protein
VKYGEYYSCGRDIYIVSRFDTNMYGLICINTGNRWTAPVKAEDSHDIPITIFTGDEKLFKKVKVSIKTEGK